MEAKQRRTIDNLKCVEMLASNGTGIQREQQLSRNHTYACYLQEMDIFLSTPFIKTLVGASLVAQWLRICLLMQGTRVRALVWEDPTCHGAAGPVSHNY